MAIDSAPGTLSLSELYRAYCAERRAEHDLSLRDAAQNVGVTAAELAMALCAAGEATALEPAPAPLLERIVPLGRVTARSESRYARLESVGTYGAPDIGEHTGIVIGDNIDLRVFPSGWASAYAVTGSSGSAPSRSIEIFDDAGAPAHTIVLGPESDLAAFERLARELALTGGGAPLALAPAAHRPQKNDADIDVPAYRQAYAAMGDTHDFFMLLRRFGLAREQGLRLAEPAFARPLAADAHRQLFARATAERIPLMLFVANEGMVQISSGLIPEATCRGRSYELVDARFALRLHEDGVARAWAVRKPTVNGIVTSLECYDAAGTLALQVFGERHEGVGERPDWARAIAELPS